MPGNGPVRFGGRPSGKGPAHRLAPRRSVDPTQTLKKWLRAQAAQPATIAQLQAQLDAFTSEYNHRRPHRSLPQQSTPATTYAARPRASPGDRAADTHDRVRTDRIWAAGTVTLRHAGKLHHIGVGRQHPGTEVLILTQDLRIRIISKATGELLRELTLNPDRDYQPTGKPHRPRRKIP
jgi:hypothetical protein